jgi:hypothetical protein
VHRHINTSVSTKPLLRILTDVSEGHLHTRHRENQITHQLLSYLQNRGVSRNITNRSANMIAIFEVVHTWCHGLLPRERIGLKNTSPSIIKVIHYRGWRIAPLQRFQGVCLTLRGWLLFLFRITADDCFLVKMKWLLGVAWRHPPLT